MEFKQVFSQNCTYELLHFTWIQLFFEASDLKTVLSLCLSCHLWRRLTDPP